MPCASKRSKRYNDIYGNCCEVTVHIPGSSPIGPSKCITRRDGGFIALRKNYIHNFADKLGKSTLIINRVR